MKFYDRINELSILQENEQQSYNSAVFTVLMGRRRVGKTSLITKSLEGKEYAYLFVSKDSEALLCQNFQRDLEQQIGLTIYGEVTRFKDLFEVIMTSDKLKDDEQKPSPKGLEIIKEIVIPSSLQ